MGKLTLDLELVTPLFLGGANARGDPELRAAPIRGVLRYWLRVWLGAHGILEDAMLRHAESRIFGDTQVGSSVILRVAPTNEQQLGIDRRSMLPHNPAKLSPTPAFVEGQSIRLTLLPRPGHEELPPDALAALFLWLNLGGLGKRQRRGFGSFRLTRFEAEELALPTDLPVSLRSPSLPADGQTLAQVIKDTLQWAMVAPISLGVCPQFPTLARNQARVLVCRAAFKKSGTPTYEPTMNEFWLKGLRSSALADPAAYGYARGRERRASPVHLHIARSQQGYHLVLTALVSEPSPSGKAGWQKVTNLMEFCRDRWQGEYVW